MKFIPAPDISAPKKIAPSIPQKKCGFTYTPDPKKIPAHVKKVVDVTPPAGQSVKVLYACPSECWTEHHRGWIKELRAGNQSAAEPFPDGHCCFERPTEYGYVPYTDGDLFALDPIELRAAWDSYVRGMLDGGWSRGVDPELFEKIVEETVAAKMAGIEVGAGPFVACIYAGLNL